MRNVERIRDCLDKGPKFFSDLKRFTGLENGVVQYHLKNSDDFMVEKDAAMISGTCEKCGLKGVCREKCIQAFLDDSSKKRLLSLFIEGLSQREIGEKLDLSAATVNYHLKRMQELNLIQGQNVKEEVRNRL